MSDIGEQWSPQTAPAIHAEIDIIIIVWFVPENVFTTIGIRIPNVPHDVPVAKARNTATRNITDVYKRQSLNLQVNWMLNVRKIRTICVSSLRTGFMHLR